jgi:Xaa-Pro aminopeptidase
LLKNHIAGTLGECEGASLAPQFLVKTPAMTCLSQTGCLARRERLLDELGRQRIDLAVISDPRDIYYFTGVFLPADLPGALLVAADGAMAAAFPEGTESNAAVRRFSYAWNHRGTRHPDIVRRAAKALREAAAALRGITLGVQSWDLRLEFKAALDSSMRHDFQCLEELIAAIQRRKDPDEVGIIRASVRANLGAYAAARQAIRPGVSELDVLAAGYRGAMEAAGEKVFHDGDYRCGQYNGPARDRPIEAGELYIVDAWTCYRGYWSDMSRTFVVGRAPMDFQRQLYDHIRSVQREAAKLLKPGVDGSLVYQAMDELIRQHPPLADQGLIHHGGHAIGLRAHEMPDINLDRGGVLEPGNVICLEPGGYVDEARLGVRLENMYLITESGCEDLCPGQVELYVCE